MRNFRCLKFFCLSKRNVFYTVLVGLFVLTCIIFSATDSLAHKVNIFAYAEGGMVYTESYFPDGRKVEGGTIEVYDSQGNKLLSGTTNEKGQFNFPPPKKDDLKIVIVASMGHKNSYLISRNELSDIAGRTGVETSPNVQSSAPKESAVANPSEVQTSTEVVSPSQPVTSGQQVDLYEIKKIIDQSLDQKLAPVIRELVKSQQKEGVTPTEIFGGIGYIFGIIGLIFYFNQKNKQL